MVSLAIKEDARTPEIKFSFEANTVGKGGSSLYLPYGYENINEGGDRVIAVEIYRMLFRFADVCRRNKHSTDLKKEPDPEGNITAPHGLDYRRSSEPTLPDFSFRLITALRELFSLLCTPTILTLRPQAVPYHGHFDWRQIEKQLHRAMYLPDGAPVFHAMDAPQSVLRDQTVDIVGMACWVARDASVNLLGESLQSIAGSGLGHEWGAIADDFAERYLGRFQSLFSDSSNKTCRELRHILLEIDRHTSFRSPRYLDLFDLLEAILSYHVFGNGGDIWAMSGFAYAWESICVDHAIDTIGKQKGYEIFTCDDEYLDRAIVDQKALRNWNKNRLEVFSRNARDRRPDLVIRNKDGTKWRIIDFKYYSESELSTEQKQRPTHDDYRFCKPAQDLDNLEAYGLLLATSRHHVDPKNITYEIWVPAAKAGFKSWTLKSPYKSQWCIKVMQMESRELVKAYGNKFRMLALGA